MGTIKIVWHSNAPFVSTGYGSQTALFAPRFNEAGHEIVISSFYGLEGSPIGWRGIPVLPSLGGTFGNESLPGHAKAFFGEPRGGLVITLMDCWVLDAQAMSKMNVASWCPVDHDPAPPAVLRYFDESGAIPIAMSRFGEERLAEFGPLYVPHAVDTKAYRPIGKREARKAAGLSDSQFVVGMVAANKGNPSRKCFPQALMAFKAIRERHDDAILALHTEMNSSNGQNITQMVAEMGLAESVRAADQYGYVYHPSPPEEMAKVYSTFDVLLNPAMGEGFGLTPLEAQACGTPVIVTDFSAMSEVCGAGWKVKSTPHFTGQMAWQREPDIEDIVESLEECYAMPRSLRKSTSERARAHALRYDADGVMTDYWTPALEEIEARIGSRPEIKAAA